MLEHHLLWRREEDYFSARLYHLTANINRVEGAKPYPLSDLMIYKIKGEGEPDVDQLSVDPIAAGRKLKAEFKQWTDSRKRAPKGKRG